MKTYQDLIVTGSSEQDICEFCRAAVNEHKSSAAYRLGAAAERYYAKHNVTIENFQKLLYNMRGQAVVDNWSANYKLKTHFFRRFVTQQVQYVLSNGVSFEREETSAKLGKNFDNVIQRMAKKAVIDGVCFGYWNKDHIEVFPFVDTEFEAGFAPIYDRDTSLLRAGVRYWSFEDNNKTVKRYTLFEEDGITEIYDSEAKAYILEPKHGYLHTVRASESSGVEEEFYTNYPTFPIFPMWANDLHTSELDGNRETIDCYDYIKSGLANDIDDTSGFYWVLQNTGGMDDVDLARFIERMRTVRAAVVDTDEGVSAEAHTLDIPTAAREAMLNRLEDDLYKDFQLINVHNITGNNQTATAIRAMYQPQDDKCGDFEYHIREFVLKVLDIAGIDDTPSFKWNRIANQAEETNMILAAAEYLDKRTVLKHLPWIMPEEIDSILEAETELDTARMGLLNE